MRCQPSIPLHENLARGPKIAWKSVPSLSTGQMWRLRSLPKGFIKPIHSKFSGFNFAFARKVLSKSAFARKPQTVPKRPLTTKSDFNTSALSFQIESKCFQYLKKGPLRQNPTSKHPLYHFKSSPRLFNTSWQAFWWLWCNVSLQMIVFYWKNP